MVQPSVTVGQKVMHVSYLHQIDDDNVLNALREIRRRRAGQKFETIQTPAPEDVSRVKRSTCIVKNEEGKDIDEYLHGRGASGVLFSDWNPSVEKDLSVSSSTTATKSIELSDGSSCGMEEMSASENPEIRQSKKREEPSWFSASIRGILMAINSLECGSNDNLITQGFCGGSSLHKAPLKSKESSEKEPEESDENEEIQEEKQSIGLIQNRLHQLSQRNRMLTGEEVGCDQSLLSEGKEFTQYSIYGKKDGESHVVSDPNVQDFLLFGKYSVLQLHSVSQLLHGIENRLRIKDDKNMYGKNPGAYSFDEDSSDPRAVKAQFTRVTSLLGVFLEDHVYRATEGGDAPTLAAVSWDEEITLEDISILHDSLFYGGCGERLPTISSFDDVKYERFRSFDGTENSQPVQPTLREHMKILHTVPEKESTMTYKINQEDQPSLDNHKAHNNTVHPREMISFGRRGEETEISLVSGAPPLQLGLAKSDQMPLVAKGVTSPAKNSFFSLQDTVSTTSSVSDQDKIWANSVGPHEEMPCSQKMEEWRKSLQNLSGALQQGVSATSSSNLKPRLHFVRLDAVSYHDHVSAIDRIPSSLVIHHVNDDNCSLLSGIGSVSNVANRCTSIQKVESLVRINEDNDKKSDQVVKNENGVLSKRPKRWKLGLRFRPGNLATF